MRRGLVAATVLASALALSACGEDEPGAAGSTPESSVGAEPTGSAGAAEDGDQTSIEVEISGDRVTPSGERVEVPVNTPLRFVITSDASGELHVHSDPEQALEYAAGTTVLELDPIDKPGIVEVESHELGTTIVQLEVR